MENINYCSYTSYEIAVIYGFNGNPSEWMQHKKANNFIDSNISAIQYIRKIVMDFIFAQSKFQTALITRIDEEFSTIKYEYDRERRTYSFKIKKTVAKKKKGYAPDTLFFRGVLSGIVSSILENFKSELISIFLQDEVIKKWYNINGSGNFNMFCTLTASKITDPYVVQSLFDIYATGDNSFSLII